MWKAAAGDGRRKTGPRRLIKCRSASSCESYPFNDTPALSHRIRLLQLLTAADA